MTKPKPSFFSFKAIIENPKMRVSLFWVTTFKGTTGSLFHEAIESLGYEKLLVDPQVWYAQYITLHNSY